MLDDKHWLSALGQTELAFKSWVKKDCAATRDALAKARMRLFDLAHMPERGMPIRPRPQEEGRAA